MCKIINIDKERIIQLWERLEGNVTVAELARFFNVSIPVISKIIDENIQKRVIVNKDITEPSEAITEDELLTITEERFSLNFKILPWTI